MSIPVSSAPAAKLALFNAIKANATIAADATIAVCYGPPSLGDLAHDDWIAVQGYHRTTSSLAMVAGGGQFWLQENYTIEVVVSVYRGGDQAETVDERCAQLVACVENAVRTDPSLGGVVTEARPVEEQSEPSWDEEGRGRFTVSTLQIAVTNATY